MEIVRAYRMWKVELWNDDTPENDHFEKYFGSYDEALEFVKTEVAEEWDVTLEEIKNGKLNNYSDNSYTIVWSDSMMRLYMEVVNGNRSDYLRLEPHYIETTKGD